MHKFILGLGHTHTHFNCPFSHKKTPRKKKNKSSFSSQRGREGSDG